MTLFKRRTVLAGIAASATAGSALLPLTMSSPVWAQARADAVPLDELLAASGLGDKELGDRNAPVTVVEYASMSCPHCARFHQQTWKPFREKYVDTGKVRFIFREFPLNTPAYAVAMVARCAPADKYHDIIDVYFQQQSEWLGSDNMYQALLDRAEPFGFTKESFDACLSNQALAKGIEEIRTKGEGFGVDATPTFFINGIRESGALTFEQLEARIDPLL